MHLLFINFILEFSFYISYLVSTFFFYWSTEDEMGFNDNLLVKLSLVLIGLILIWLTLEGKRLVEGSEL